MLRTIPRTDLSVFPLGLGGNVFGFSADEAASFAVLDAYVEAGGNLIDTADSYCCWLGTEGGESETIIGRWLRRRGRRDDVVIASKVGQAPHAYDLRPATIRTALEGTLRRLGTDHVDLYFAHEDHGDPIDETMAAFDDMVRAGKVRAIAASNFPPERLAASLAVAEANGLASYVAYSPRYNLMDRADYEQRLAPVVAEHRLGVFPWWGLASGYLTGKYRIGGPPVDSLRSSIVEEFVTERGERVLDALREIALGHGVAPAAVALAWLATRPGVVAPLASARSVEQLLDLLPMATLSLTAEELAALDSASEQVPAVAS